MTKADFDASMAGELAEHLERYSDGLITLAEYFALMAQTYARAEVLATLAGV